MPSRKPTGLIFCPIRRPGRIHGCVTQHDGELRKGFHDPRGAATGTGADALHHEVLADMRLGHDKTVNVESVIVLGIGDRAVQAFAHILFGRTLARELTARSARSAVRPRIC